MKRTALALALAAVVIAGAASSALEPRVAKLESQVAALTARVTALESPTAITETPAPTACGSLQARIDATPAGGTLALGTCAYTAPVTIARSITLTGGTVTLADTTATAVTIRASDVTLDGLTTHGGRNGIWADPAVRLVIRNATVTDALYAGIMVLSGDHCTVADNVVSRIGVGQPNGTNAYGIALSDIGGPVSADCTVSGNTVEDVPTWHGLDTHGGQRIAFTGNSVRRVSRALFLTSSDTGDATAITVADNRFESPAPVTYNLVPVTLYRVSGATFTANVITGWGSASPSASAPWYDYQGLSSGLVDGGGNLVSP